MALAAKKIRHGQLEQRAVPPSFSFSVFPGDKSSDRTWAFATGGKSYIRYIITLNIRVYSILFDIYVLDVDIETKAEFFSK